MRTAFVLFAIICCASLAFAEAPVITRGPYLQNATPRSIVIRWRTDIPTTSRVRYGLGLEALTGVVSDETPATEHEITVDGLPSDTAYLYTVGDDTADLAGPDNEHWFRTLPIAGTEQPVRVWVIGDSGTGGDGTGRAESVLQGYINSPHFAANDVWLMLGDNAYYSGTDEEYQRAVFDIYTRLLRHTRLWPAIGNHETYGIGLPYFDIFTLPRNGEAGGVASGTENYYSFDYANIHFVCLDSMLSDRTAGSPMLTWLEADLESTTQRWIIAYWHHPAYSHGTHNSDWESELVEMRENAVPILEAHGVDLVFAGHSHNYERTFLIDGHYGDSTTFTESMKKDGGSGQASLDGSSTEGAYAKTSAPHAGAVYVVAGNAGQTGSSFPHPAMFTQIDLLGSLVLDVNGGRLDAKMIGNDGVVRDYFTIAK